MMFFTGASIWALKPLLGKGSSANSLPIGLNRISWKPLMAAANGLSVSPYRLG